MPQITVEFSSNLASGLRTDPLAADLHRAVAETVGSPIGNCKTRFVEQSRVVIGGGGADQAMLHIDLRILSGRSDAQKRALGEAALAAGERALDKPEDVQVQLTVEVRDLDRDHYHKQIL